MTIKARRGWQLSGHLNGTVCPPAHRYQKSTTGGIDSVIFVGDPVSLTSAGTVTRLHDNDAAGGGQNGSNNFLGVCTGMFETEDGRPLTHRSLKYAVTADAFWLDVIDDPDATWEVAGLVTANQTSIGDVWACQYGTPVSAAGISGAGVAGSATAASGVALFRVQGIMNLQRDGANASNADQDGVVRVVPQSHVFRNTTGV